MKKTGPPEKTPEQEFLFAKCKMTYSQNRHQAFAHVTAPNAKLYRAIMIVFREAKSEYTLHLRPKDVLDGIIARGFTRPGDEDATLSDLEWIAMQLSNLENWGNLRAYQDTTEVATVDDFMRKRFLYQMTGEGEAAETALQVFREQLERPGELQTTALEDIEEKLKALRKLAESGEADQAGASSLLGELYRRFEDLTSQAQRFMGNLQQHIELYQVKEEDFIAYRDMLVDYVNRFIRQLVVSTSAVSNLLIDLEERIAPLLETAAEREFQDVLKKTEEERQRLVERQHKRWQGLRGWFLGREGKKSQAEILRGRALGAITDLLSVVQAINERKADRGDRTADLRTLARWFMECDSDSDAHRLWRAAFGLHPSRHLLTTGETLEKSRRDDHTKSWLEGPKLEISPRLRQYGSTRKKGRATPMIDRSEERQRLRYLAEIEAGQLTAARERLARDRRTLLSELHVLDPLEFELFFDLLTRALAQKKHDRETVCAESEDGTLEVVLEPVYPTILAVVHTRKGSLLTPEHHITIRDPYAVFTREAG
jgi:uncharacterized protein (TIGR02677 family)